MSDPTSDNPNRKPQSTSSEDKRDGRSKSAPRGHKPRSFPRHKRPEDPNAPQVIYGLHSVEAALRNPRRHILSFRATQNAANRLRERFDVLPLEPEIVPVKTIAHRLDGDPVHQGALLEVKPLETDDDLSPLYGHKLILALDHITDPHNVGAILRTAVAFGAGGVIVTSRHSPQQTGVLAKAASGALEMLNLVSVTNLTTAIEALSKAGFTSIALDSEGPAPLEETPLGDQTLLVLGAEGKGVRFGVRGACNTLARIDLPGQITSLNVSNAAALALYVASRHQQRTSLTRA